jgi:hypothetical protein
VSQEELRRATEALGIDLGSKDMRVLGAILKAQREPTDFVGFEEIRRQLAIDEGGRKGKDPLIYRSLMNLEQGNYLEVEKEGKKHGYRSNTGLIQRAIQRAVEERRRNLNSRIQEIGGEIDYIQSMDFQSLAESMVSLAFGSGRIQKSLFAQGWEDVLRLIDDAVYRGMKSGDIVRITLGWVDEPDDVEASRLVGIAQLIKRGIIFRALEHRRLKGPRLERYREIFRSFQEQGYEPEFRVAPRDDATYQFIARNEEGIVLIVSESPLSATWIPKTANPALVKNAVESFDEDYRGGIDVSQYRGE